MKNQDDDPLGLIGTTVADKYKIVELAGEGGFSAVYKAEHLIWHQPVAIKFFNVLEDAKPDVRESLLDDFIQEGKLMTQLSSESSAIVQARDIGKLTLPDDEWIPFMVLEWLEGTPLHEALEAEKAAGSPARSLEEAMRFLEPAAAALDIAHKHNVAHRDLKPANIMVVGDARAPGAVVKVLDFGIAKIMAAHEKLQQQLMLTGHQITAFTPNHGAPEQFTRKFGATGPWTDVYAMALIVLEAIRGGERVLQGKNYFELGVSSCDPNKRPTPRSLGLNVSDGVEAVFTRALAIEPKNRYPNMGAFWGELHKHVFVDADTWKSHSTGGHAAAQLAATELAPSHGELAPSSAAPSTTTGGLSGMVPSAPGQANTGRVMLLGVVLGGLVVAGAAFAYLLLTGRPLGHSNATPTAAPSASLSASTTASAAVKWDGPCPVGMKVVTGGSFKMGSDAKGFKLWKPAHEVTIDTFCLDVHEVSVAKYRTCVKADQCKAADARPNFPKGKISDKEHAKQLDSFAELCNWDKTDREDHPINCLDWNRANQYCAWRESKLPTEAQWELAARGTDGRKFPWGNDEADHTYMNAAGTEWKRWLASKGLPKPAGLMYKQDDGFVGTAPVTKFPRAQTESGQLNMVGNVWEWTNDWYALYKAEPQVNPRGPAAGNRKAIRGGGFNGEFSLWVNPAARYHQLATASVHVIGFRCAAEVRQAEK